MLVCAHMCSYVLVCVVRMHVVEYILNHAEIRVVVVEKENVAKMIKLLGNKVKNVEIIIQFDPNDLYDMRMWP